MAGVLWTGIDLFMGTVLGPVIGGLNDEQSAALFQRLTPKTAFLLPSLAVVTIVGGSRSPSASDGSRTPNRGWRCSPR